MVRNRRGFYSENGKRQILVVDDEAINRELLTMMLQDDYDVMTAADGNEALAIAHTHAQMLSLILLDLLMPGLHGLQVLRKLQESNDTAEIPVVVVTADQKAEVDSLMMGAADFIPKPYPQREVVLARVLHTIELYEDRNLIQSTERDPLTGLYTKEYFFRYATQYDHHHPEEETDAIVVNVNHFRMINERYGRSYGDDVLRRIGQKVREIVHGNGGIVCRRDGDTFLVYCPSLNDYQTILENAVVGLAGDEGSSDRVRLRMGVYQHADHSIDIERRFDCAQMAADRLRNSFGNEVGYYDSSLHETELYNEQLLEDFNTALQKRQFRVYYQPKFDVRPEAPVLTSAEALVRWQHPTLGMISPAVFIPLFESNGLITRLDHYVWREAIAQIADWKRRFGRTIPVSVNVSRIDTYDPSMVDYLCAVMREYDLPTEDLLLEITESAYTQDSHQIVSVAEHLRELGFRIEMDDFGSGYSSLNMISTLPFDALKLDMHFIRNVFRESHNIRMLEIIVDIARYLNVLVIAEGVETREQMMTLREKGCDIVQGYYFSKPLPAEEFERFLKPENAESDC